MTNERPAVLITGASRGLGAATARAFARAGHPVALIARDRAALDAVADEIAAARAKAIALPCDVADHGAVERATAAAVAALGAPGIVILNAGVIEPLGPLRDCDPELWARHIQINLIGAFNVLRCVVPRFQTGGVVVSISSGAAALAIPQRSAYCASKAALNVLSDVLAAEETARGIRVHGYAPGPLDTGMMATLRASGANMAWLKPGDLRPPEAAAREILWLCSAAGAELAGKLADARDPTFRQRIAAA